MIYIFHHYHTTYEQAKFKAYEAYLYRGDLTGMSRLLHSTAAENAHFSQAHGTFTKRNHILGHESHCNKLKRMEIIRCLLSEHRGPELESVTQR